MAKVKKKRAGKNPTKTEVQLRGMVASLQQTAQQLDKANQTLLGEASTVMEALWDGHQELVVKFDELTKRVDKLERRETHVEEESETPEDAAGDLQGDQEEGDGGGEAAIYSGEEGSEPGDLSKEAGEGGTEEVPEESGAGERT